MKVKEICELVDQGKITIDYSGHRVNSIKKRLIKNYRSNLEIANGGNDGKWETREGESIEKINADMREHYQSHLNKEINQEDSLRYSNTGEYYCFGCGKTFHLTLTGDKLQLRNHVVHDDKFKFGVDFVNYPPEYVCEFSKPQPNFGQITVNSQLVIANYFLCVEDAPEDLKYSSEWSLNCLSGRKKITEYKAGHNIAYGQMGNTSIGIYVNKNKDSIIIGPNYHPAELDEDSSEEDCSQPLYEGYGLFGEICLEVWRWEATELNTLNGEEPEACVKIDVPHGIWTFQHNYDTYVNNEKEEEIKYIYARLDLKK